MELGPIFFFVFPFLSFSPPREGYQYVLYNMTYAQLNFIAGELDLEEIRLRDKGSGLL